MSADLGFEVLQFERERHAPQYVHYCTDIKPQMHTDGNAAVRHDVHMPSYRESAVEYLRLVLAETGKSASELATLVGVSHTTFTRLLKNPEYKYAPKFPTLRALSEKTGVPLLPGLSAEETEPEIRYLSVMHRVQAGYWVEDDAYAQAEVDRFAHPVAVDARYAHWRQWLELVMGDSANKKVADGAFVHVVDSIDMGYSPRHGDWVIVERRRAGLRERTIKQVEISGRQVALWPRSTNPKWSEPVDLTAGAAEQDIEVEVVGLVIGAYSPF